TLRLVFFCDSEKPPKLPIGGRTGAAQFTATTAREFGASVVGVIWWNCDQWVRTSAQQLAPAAANFSPNQPLAQMVIAFDRPITAIKSPDFEFRFRICNALPVAVFKPAIN